MVYIWIGMTVNPIINMQEILQDDKEVLVTRTTKMSKGISISSLSVDAISAICSEAEAITFFMIWQTHAIVLVKKMN